MKFAPLALTTLATLVIFAGCSTNAGHVPPTTDSLEPYECGSLTRLHTYGGIFLASQPKPADLEEAKQGGVKTVINLRHKRELDFDERAKVESLGMSYVVLAFGKPAELTDAIFDRGRELLSTAQRPMMMHCKSSNRVGALWLVWRVLDGGLSMDLAAAEAKTVGLKSPGYLAKAKAYVARRQVGSR